MSALLDAHYALNTLAYEFRNHPDELQALGEYRAMALADVFERAGYPEHATEIRRAWLAGNDTSNDMHDLYGEKEA